MMGKPKRKCVVCRRESSATVSLLQFPRGDATVLPQWLEFSKIGASDLSGNSRICSLHFTHNCFKSAVKEGRRVILKNGAVPTILRDEPVAVAIPTNTEGNILTNPLDINHNVRRHRSTYVRKNKEGPKLPVVRYCYICGTVYTSTPCISFFRFPKDAERRRTWMESLGIEEAELCDSQRLCSQHFPDGSKYNVPVRHLINLFIDVNSSGQAVMPDMTISDSMDDCPAMDEPFPPTTNLDHDDSQQHVLNSSTPPNREINGSIDGAVMPDMTISDSMDDCPAMDEPFPLTTNLDHDDSQQHVSSSTPPNLEINGSIDGAVMPSVAMDCVSLEHNVSLQHSLYTPSPNNPEQGIHASVTTPISSKRKFRFFQDFKTPDLQTPRRKRRCLNLGRSQIIKYKTRINKLYLENKRMQSKITKLEQALTTLHDNGLLSDCATDTLQSQVPKSMAEVIERHVEGKKRGKFPVEIRKFALGISFYSAKAYAFLRKEWPALPAPSTLRSWYQVVDCRPGFTREAFNALQTISEGNAALGKQTIVNLILDEMKIKKRVEFDPQTQRTYGYVDMGNDLSNDDDSQHQATGVFVIMVAAVNSFWKVPVGYFVITSLNGSERSNIISLALTQLHDVGIKCCSLTFDCEAANISMVNQLGANLKYGTDQFKPWFQHPCADNRVYVYPDPSHMVKLVRNTFGERGPLIDSQSRTISWSHIRGVYNKQQHEGLHLANKLSKRHVNYATENKQKVALAVQVLSNSVSVALRWLSNKDVDFNDVDGTAEFCNTFNDAFDVLNCRNILSNKPCGKPIKPETYLQLQQRANDIITYISKLQLSNGVLIIHSERKAGFLGFIVCLQNVFNIYDQCTVWGMKYVLSYKLLQDHLENLFSAVRSKGGFNNNSTSRQFESAYRRLLIHGVIVTSDRSNCILDNLQLLHCCRRNTTIPQNDGENQDLQLESVLDHDYFSTAWELTEYQEEVLDYIGGFVVRKSKRNLNCQNCCSFLEVSGSHNIMTNSLYNMKNRGGLVRPHPDVVTILKAAEQKFRGHFNLMNKKSFVPSFLSSVVREVHDRVFLREEVINHLHNLSVIDDEDHRTVLIKSIALHFINIRITYECKSMSEPASTIRHKFKRLVIDRNL